VNWLSPTFLSSRLMGLFQLLLMEQPRITYDMRLPFWESMWLVGWRFPQCRRTWLVDLGT
jgi:hypothetical protein